MSLNPSNDNTKKPSQFSLATLYAAVRIILGMVSAGTFGVVAQRYLPPDTIKYINDNLPTVVPAAIMGATFLYGVYTRLRSTMIKTTANLKGAQVVLDSHAEVAAINNPSVLAAPTVVTDDKKAA